MDTPISLVNERLNTLCENVGNMAQEMAKMRECMGGLRADVIWLKKSFWLLASIAGGTLVTGAVTVLLRYKQ